MPRLTAHHAHWPEGVPRQLELPDRHLFDHLERFCDARVLIATEDVLSTALPLLADGSLSACVTGAYSELAGRAEDVPFLSIPPIVVAPP